MVGGSLSSLRCPILLLEGATGIKSVVYVQNPRGSVKVNIRQSMFKSPRVMGESKLLSDLVVSLELFCIMN